MNYAVVPSDILKFGDQLANDFGPRAQTILANVKAARAPMNYFALIPRAIEAISPYTEMHNQLVKHAESIVENVLHAADRFRETAQVYAQTDDDGRKQMNKLADDLGHARGTDLDPDTAPKPAARDGAGSGTSNDYYEKPGERTSYGDRVLNSLPGFGASLTKLISDWSDADNPDGFEIAAIASDGYGVIQNAVLEPMAFLGDPLGYLVSNGLGFLLKICTPLKQLIDTVGTGNPDGIKACSSRYADIAKDLERFATDLVGAAHAGIPYWEGDAATAASAKVAAFVNGIHGTAAVAGEAAGALQLFAVLSQALEDIVLGFIGDLVQNMIVIWLAALADAVPTAGASTAAAATESEVAMGETTIKAGKAVEETTSIFKRLKALLDRLGKRLMHNDTLRTRFQSGPVHTTAPITPKKLLGNAGSRLIGTDKTTMPKVERTADGGVTMNGGLDEHLDPAKVSDKATGYAKTADTTVKDFSIGTDESDEEIDEQLNFGG